MTGDLKASELRRLVVGVDDSLSSRCALEWAARFALATGAEVIAVHAVDVPGFIAGIEATDAFASEDVRMAWKGWKADVERVLEEDWCMPLRQTGVSFTAKVVEGGARGLLGLAHREHADAIVVGRRGRGGFAELVLGSFSHHLVHHSTVPVVVVPQERD